MSEDVADVNLLPIIMQGGDQSNFVAADIKDGEFPDLVGVRKDPAQLHEIQKSAFPHYRVPMRERGFGIRVLLSEFIQALPRDDVHYAETYPALLRMRSHLCKRGFN